MASRQLLDETCNEKAHILRGDDIAAEAIAGSFFFKNKMLIFMPIRIGGGQENLAAEVHAGESKALRVGLGKVQNDVSFVAAVPDGVAAEICFPQSGPAVRIAHVDTQHDVAIFPCNYIVAKRGTHDMLRLGEGHPFLVSEAVRFYQ